MSRVFGTLLARLWGKTDAPVSKKSAFRPVVENLEERRVPANIVAPATGSISGHVFVDTTGNGAASLGAGESGVPVFLVADTNHDGVLDGGDRLMAAKTTDATGAYSFNGLAPGTYFVREFASFNSVRTMPASTPGYADNLTQGQSVTGNDFANFNLLNRQAVTRVSFTVTDASGTHTYGNLRGNTKAGDTVTAHFTVAHGANVTLSLVAYTTSPPANPRAVGPYANNPVLTTVATDTFGPGQHTLSIQMPNNFYQVDFVVGAPITNLSPAPSDLNYTAQDRLLSQDIGGQAPPPVVPATLSGNVFQDDGSDTINANESGVDSATVTLVGMDSTGHTVNVSTITDGSGNYSFANVLPGTYTVTVSVFGYVNEQSSVPAAEATATQAEADTGTISNVHVASGGTYTDFDFLELLNVTGPGS